MGLVNRILQLGFELFLAFITVGLVLAVLIPVLRHLHWMPGYPWGALLAGVLLVLAVALTTFRPGGSLRPRV
jgi:hypothetical protein